jgi:hypothetical protein
MVRNILTGALALVATSVLATGACAQASSSQTTTATSTIFQPIVLAKNTDLSFGTVVRPASGNGTVTVAASDGARSLTGSGALISGGPNAAAGRATYTVTGEGGQTYSISVPANMNMAGPASSTLVVTLTPTATSGTLSGVLGATGTQTFGVGGAIPIANTTTSGAYTGTFAVTVAYN